MKRICIAALVFLISHGAIAGLSPVGAAPKGDAEAVANRIIKYNFPTCKNVVAATRKPNGSILATCDKTNYLVFTIFNASEGNYGTCNELYGSKTSFKYLMLRLKNENALCWYLNCKKAT